AYTTDGALLQKTVNGGDTIRYFGKLFMKVGDSWRERIVANGEVVTIVTVNSAGYPTTDYMIHDNLGSPAALLDASGNLAARFAWDAWGEMVDPAKGYGTDPGASSKEALTTLGYTGHEMFWEQGLVHTYARLYNPGTGRWLSPDCTVPHPYNGQSFNRYSYVLNNPATLWDPRGLSSSTPVCSADKFMAPPNSDNQLSEQVRNAGQAFVSIAEKTYFGGDSGLTENVALSMVVGQLAAGLARTTFEEGVRDAEMWQIIGGHLVSVYDSWINWPAKQIPWGEYGAVPVAQGGNEATAVQALCNLIEAGNSAGISDDNNQNISGNHSAVVGGTGLGIMISSMWGAYETQIWIFVTTACAEQPDGSCTPIPVVPI
ncbi:MAG: RHS repeat domain-containing protein, partial [Candidatus Saccharimonadales bacterium]